MNNTVKVVTVIVVVLAVAGGLYYAFGYNHPTSTSTNTGSGTLNFFVYDAPTTNASAVYLTFSNVSIHGNTTGWTNYSLGSHTVNILGLTATNASLLKGVTLSAQEYTQIRLYVTAVTVTVLGLNVSYNLASQYALINHAFTVKANSTNNVNIQFNLTSDLNVNAKQFTPNVGFTFTTGTPQVNGKLNFWVYDAPLANVSAVYLTFSNVSIHGNTTGWTNYTVMTQKVDILNLTLNNASLLNSLNLSAQQYTMLRLYVQNVTVTVNGVNVTFNLASPYAFVNHPFNVTAGGNTNVNIQFNLTSDLNLNSKIFTPNVGETVTS